MFEQRWLLYALLSALAAATIPLLGKKGMEGIDTNLATAVRSIVMTVLLVCFCAVSGVWSKVGSIHSKALGLIALSGAAGAVSWLLYFKALQTGQPSQVAPIDKLSMPIAVVLAVLMFRTDRPTWPNWCGIALISLGGYLAALPRHP